jgi:hypothetical protein
MAQISQDAMSAMGHATDPGIYAWTNNVDSSSICFRQDLANTPQDYNDDPWVCYYHDDSFDIQRCPGTAHFFPPACTNSNQCCAGVPESKRAKLLSMTSSTGEFAEIVNDASGRFEYIKLSLAARFDQGKPVHPIDNPERSLTTKISPPGHSR